MIMLLIIPIIALYFVMFMLLPKAAALFIGAIILVFNVIWLIKGDHYEN